MKNILTLAAISLFAFAAPAFASHEITKEEMMKCDKNNDGAIDKAEFMDKKAEMFKEADKNGDGKLSSTEIDELIKEKKAKHD